MNKVKFVLFSAGISLALALTFSCSSGGGGGEQSYDYCVTASNTCLVGPYTVSACNGQVSNSCPDGSTPIVGRSSSSGGGTFSRSSSGGKGVPFNENSQIYIGYYVKTDGYEGYRLGEAYTGSGDIESYGGVTIGSVKNGIVNLNLPQMDNGIEYYETEKIKLFVNSRIENFDIDIDINKCIYAFVDADDTTCSIRSSPIGEIICRYDDIDDKIECSAIDIVNSTCRWNYMNYDKIECSGSRVICDSSYYLDIWAGDDQESMSISYMYFSEAGKIAYTRTHDDGWVGKYNIDAKAGWNRVYHYNNYRNGTSEISTNNILTKEVKWIVDFSK